jgi:hypothetical protein
VLVLLISEESLVSLLLLLLLLLPLLTMAGSMHVVVIELGEVPLSLELSGSKGQSPPILNPPDSFVSSSPRAELEFEFVMSNNVLFSRSCL